MKFHYIEDKDAIAVARIIAVSWFIVGLSAGVALFWLIQALR